jgi:DNA-binding MarR family transcriptional regulator
MLTNYNFPLAWLWQSRMAYAIDVDEVSGCTCRRARRTARRLTQIYDRALDPSGLTANQFDLLANLFAATLTQQKSFPIGVLAARMGMHPTTVARDLVPLIARGFVAETDDPRDRRIRSVLITRKGHTKLRRAVPLWRRAQRQVQAALGTEVCQVLNAVLDATSAKLTV